MELFFIIGLVVILIVLYVVFSLQSDGQKKEEVKEKIELIKIFINSQLEMEYSSTFISEAGYAIAINNDDREVCLIDNNKNQMYTRIVTFNDVLASEIFIDGNTITRTEKKNILGRSVVGGALFGSTGAVIGGLSGETVSVDRTHIKRIGLRIFINDHTNPLFELIMNDSNIMKNSSKFINYSSKLQELFGLTKVIIQNAKDDQKEDNSSEEIQKTPRSIADEINKLANLLKEGLISNDEFENLKENLIHKRSK
jgi:hypothetical protein